MKPEVEKKAEEMRKMLEELKQLRSQFNQHSAAGCQIEFPPEVISKIEEIESQLKLQSAPADQRTPAIESAPADQSVSEVQNVPAIESKPSVDDGNMEVGGSSAVRYPIDELHAEIDESVVEPPEPILEDGAPESAPLADYS